jgi:hypothetical protein
LQHLIFQELQVTDSHRRQKPGPGKPLTAQREHYFRLMKEGLNNSEACRLVGIHRSTGQHWRHGFIQGEQALTSIGHRTWALFSPATALSSARISVNGV